MVKVPSAQRTSPDFSGPPPPCAAPEAAASLSPDPGDPIGTSPTRLTGDGEAGDEPISEANGLDAPARLPISANRPQIVYRAEPLRGARRPEALPRTWSHAGEAAHNCDCGPPLPAAPKPRVGGASAFLPRQCQVDGLRTASGPSGLHALPIQVCVHDAPSEPALTTHQLHTSHMSVEDRRSTPTRRGVRLSSLLTRHLS